MNDHEMLEIAQKVLIKLGKNTLFSHEALFDRDYPQLKLKETGVLHTLLMTQLCYIATLAMRTAGSREDNHRVRKLFALWVMKYFTPDTIATMSLSTPTFIFEDLPGLEEPPGDPIPYGGAPGEIQEDDEEVPWEDDYGAQNDNQERCPDCDTTHAPPACGGRKGDRYDA